jgi:hypothetical protein
MYNSRTGPLLGPQKINFFSSKDSGWVRSNCKVVLCDVTSGKFYFRREDGNRKEALNHEVLSRVSTSYII